MSVLLRPPPSSSVLAGGRRSEEGGRSGHATPPGAGVTAPRGTANCSISEEIKRPVRLQEESRCLFASA
ncbi:hypothetical protein EYF80_067984 [Liparis tanakae]|uniref:Uncharacterized protein n=1 Tax=Liparis tanakae TaxID=230148 RepID=A0A4Z2DZF0_9TELE|nr:hypothetical protein EYF80_067984 [Liparis tanakae]